jgi:cytochrome c556
MPISAHEHATGVVKERMDAMERMEKHDKAIAERIKNNRDLTGIKTEAEAIAALASHIPHLFPKGSNQAPTRARSAIWRDWSDFERKAQSLEAASRTLAKADPGDANAIRSARTAMSKACETCHDKFRSGRR